MTLTAAQQLRQKLGERIPPGGTDSDTMFSDDEIDHFLIVGVGDLNAAALEGWIAKAAELSNLVNKAEGPARDDLSDLHVQALKQIEMFAGLVDSGGTSGVGRTRIGIIRRPELGL